MQDNKQKALLITISERFNDSASPSPEFTNFVRNVAGMMQRFAEKETIEIVDQPNAKEGQLLVKWNEKDDNIYKIPNIWNNAVFAINAYNSQYQLEIEAERLEFDLPVTEQTLS